MVVFEAVVFVLGEGLEGGRDGDRDIAVSNPFFSMRNGKRSSVRFITYSIIRSS